MGGVQWNYLRVRGEYAVHHRVTTVQLELPPRARRIPCGAPPIKVRAGTTSACAENTNTAQTRLHTPRNYLRVRGEYRLGHGQSRHLGELPPRARRILILGLGHLWLPGTTSACAENTRGKPTPTGDFRNYLRVRGEYFTAFTQSGSCRELPPRARRIPPHPAQSCHTHGTTSACAENTQDDSET